MKNKEKIVEALNSLTDAVQKLREAIEEKCDSGEVSTQGQQEETPPPGDGNPKPPGSGNG